MRTETPPTIRLKDYTPPAYGVERTDLRFQLHPTATRVHSRLSLVPGENAGDLALDGVGLTRHSLSIDGAPVDPAHIRDHAEGIVIARAALPAAPFTLEAEVEINPEANTSLEGLYMSNGMYCTQCEAEGFRKITYYPDRPDVMARFFVRVEGDLPVLLSNGNPTASGDGWAEWDDPWPKPAYLFALVAGDLVAVRDTFTTASGRSVQLAVWVRPGDEGKCDYALDALKRSMRWDEEAYGREYDLDHFNIVAVGDFNMGAMENKGLNIFNSKYVLASPDTATDRDFELVEGIIAHEYFHNWTGNRITCRDWFQLCLKEGLTVFRDQQFSGDERSHAVKRIEDVEMLKSRQFREDAGPLAHPVRPEEYIEINNFYTATVYEKGAEVIRMLHAIIGPEKYRKALDLYFDRHDGEACTIEDWLQVFEDATGEDLSRFRLWYSQAGTPTVETEEAYVNGLYSLTLRQSTEPTPGQPEKAPLVIPVAYGFLGSDGSPIGPEGVIRLEEEALTVTFELPERPVASLLRGFSAPVNLEQVLSREDRTLLLAHDPDPFNRWEAGRRLATETLISMATVGAEPDALFLDAMATAAADEDADPAFRAKILDLPSEDDLADAIARDGSVPDPDRIHAARHHLKLAVAERLGDGLRTLRDAMAVPGPYRPAAEDAGKRALANTCLAYLTAIEADAATATAQFDAATNMTDSFAALACLVTAGKAEGALQTFHARWKDDPNVLDKWFSVQAGRAAPEIAVDAVKALTERVDFTWKTPNRFRSVFGAFAMMNHAGFHRADGAGYALFADWLMRLDPLNPQTAARMTTAFETRSRYDEGRQSHMKAALERIASMEGLSKDTSEMVGRILG